MVRKLIEGIGGWVVKIVSSFGQFLLFQSELIFLIFKPPFRWRQILEQIYFIGFGSLGVIFLTAFFTGLVEAVQLYRGFHEFGVEDFMGYTIFLSIVKELGPVFASLMVVSRGISAYAAELGSMRVTEQIDALDVMAVNSKQFLVVPRIIATIISLPILILFFDAVANVGAYLISVHSLDVNGYTYLENIKLYGKVKDFFEGVVKGAIFGYLISAIGTYIGYNTRGGAKGVGRATTLAVVIASITIFIADYIISALYLIFSE